MISIPVVLLLIAVMLMMTMIIFAYEYGKQMKELKTLKEEITILKSELSYERWTRKALRGRSKYELYDTYTAEKHKK